MKYITAVLCLILGMHCLSAAEVVTGKKNAVSGNFILATVNGEVITEMDVLPLTRSREKQARAVYSGERLKKAVYDYRKEVVNELIDSILVQKEFSRANYNLSKQEIEREIDKFGMRIGCRSREQLLRRLHKDGATMDELYLNVRKNLMVQIMLFRQVKIADPVTPKELYEYFKASEASYAVPEKVGLAMLKLDSTVPDLKKLSADITAELNSDPSKFDSLVRRYNPGTDNGSLGEIDSKLLRPEFAAAFKKFKVGLVAGPIQSYDGVIWLKITSYKAAEKADFAAVSERIKDELERKKREKVLQNYIQQLRKGAVIEYFL